MSSKNAIFIIRFLKNVTNLFISNHFKGNFTCFAAFWAVKMIVCTFFLAVPETKKFGYNGDLLIVTVIA